MIPIKSPIHSCWSTLRFHTVCLFQAGAFNTVPVLQTHTLSLSARFLFHLMVDGVFFFFCFFFAFPGSGIFYHNSEQKKLAEEAMEAWESARVQRPRHDECDIIMSLLSVMVC